MKKNLVCQEELDHKIWGALPMFIVGHEECLLQMKSSILIEVNDLLLEEEETDAFYALTCAIFNMGLIACQSVVSFAAFSD